MTFDLGDAIQEYSKPIHTQLIDPLLELIIAQSSTATREAKTVPQRTEIGDGQEGNSCWCTLVKRSFPAMSSKIHWDYWVKAFGLMSPLGDGIMVDYPQELSLFSP